MLRQWVIRAKGVLGLSENFILEGPFRRDFLALERAIDKTRVFV